MRIFLTTLVLIAFSAVSTCCCGQEPTDYRTAYKKSQEGDKPLLILVTAEWCPPCQVMKKTTIPELLQKNAFKDFNYSTVDLDKEEKLARQLIGNRGVPQLIMYEKQDQKWIRRYLTGYQSPQTVEAFVAQAGLLRTADASQNVVDNK